MSDPPAPALNYDDPTKTEGERAPPRPSLVGPRFVPGTTIGHYELIRQIGQGGMGEVYLARDTRLGRRVALKFLLKVDRKHSDRFLVEARATAQLAHENIVALYDIAEHDGLPYMVLEYVSGTTLSAWLRNRRASHPTPSVPPTRAAELMLPVARALQCAQEANIVHRDLKPSNIMLTDSGTVKVLDFGVAKLLGDVALAEDGGDVDGPCRRHSDRAADRTYRCVKEFEHIDIESDGSVARQSGDFRSPGYPWRKRIVRRQPERRPQL
jgi:serine/threonine protein kinase